MTNAMSLAKQFGVIQELTPEIQAEIERLSRQPYLELDQVKRCHAWMYELVISRMTGLLLGESRCGKTVTCKAFANLYNKLRQTKGQRMKPVVYIQVGKNCGSRDFFMKILKALNKPSNGTISDLRERTLDSLAIHQVEMLIIDEANHLKFETFSDVRHIYDDDELKISVLLVGTTSRLLAIVKRDEQVVNRFLEQFELDRLEDTQFKQMIQIWERDVLRLPEESKLASGDNLKILKQATKKLIGRLDMILRKAAIRSLLRGQKQVDKDILKEVIAASKL
ncbi:TniB family NTP-binding protein [Nostoc sp. 'Peltigera membranacea cyanobiont' 232]|uniref:TniB family NTP-binding protein n=1 Tax=Nostoc sp. 'Peltigera membranacea cyanobiont' 232 TaxID=2014531 RepID=UPI000B951185|nr:TniB family NTP-binding protein [Nostoc sp. 'Peltigera membranacea cyanobiont' 232]OYE02881.1 transposase [Nostoc sp. 'Peltigera membranacea cyanobiont' 232]